MNISDGARAAIAMAVCILGQAGAQDRDSGNSPFSSRFCDALNPHEAGLPNCPGVCHGGLHLECAGTSVSPMLTVRAGGVFLVRHQSDSVFFMTNTGAVFAPNLGFQAGIKLNANLPRDCLDIEMAYLGLLSGDDQGFPPTGFMNGQFFGGGTLPTTPNLTLTNFFVQNSYQSTLNSLEFNLKNNHNDLLTLLAGVRWLNLDESFDYVFDDLVARTGTDNNLFGLQLGAEGRLANIGRFHVDASTKAGVFYNDADYRVAFTGLPPPPPPLVPAVRDNEDQFSFVGEIELTGTFELNDRLAVRVGYQLMWLQGVALAPEQIVVTNLTTASGMDATGGVFWHGGIAQVEMTW